MNTPCLELHTPHTIALELLETEDRGTLEQALVLCPRCYKALTTLRRRQERLDHPSLLVACEVDDAGERWQELLDVPPEHRRSYIATEPLTHLWGFAVRLLEEAEARRFDSPHDSALLAQLAADVASRLDPSFYGERWCADLAARAAAAVANGHRLLRNLPAARQALARADRHFLRGTLRPRIAAELRLVQASVERDDQRLAEAEEQAYEALERAQAAQAPVPAVKARILLATIASDRGDHQHACSILSEVLVCDLPHIPDPRLEWLVLHNLSIELLEIGNRGAIRQLIERLPEDGDPLLSLRRSWLTAYLERHEGDPEAAEATYREMRQSFLDLRLYEEAALVSLELACLYLQLGREDDALEAAREVEALLVHAPGSHPVETLKAILGMLHDARFGRLDRALLGKIRSFVLYLPRRRRLPR